VRRLATAKSSGFTLIEIMVVIFVIGITAVGVSLVIGGGGPDTELRKAVERFATLSDFASERAILSGRPVGLMLEPPAWRKELDENLEKSWRYRWQMMGPTGWEDDPNLETVELPPSVQLDVTVEGQMWEWEDAPEVRLPVVVFYPSGEVTPFKIEFRDQRIPDFSQNVVVNTWGEVEWLEQARRTQEATNGF
jgi:general secretion pathway protein H